MIQNKTENRTLTGVLTYDQKYRCLSLNDTVLLHSNDPLAVEMLGQWVVGWLQRDSRGWYLLTPYQTGIRLYPGLTASTTPQSGGHT